ncbi:MAG: Prefoldin subunit-domain-containing protein [Olpidium bornovanus]|uniref:Prefoldin subunit-domain-containing protein n=1 Tax=Olpidium bornovanus TaxID=278681 RepID=A0A8H8DJL4_9FUNG|nr:MAG: Prefoldin subunit-domain-containing protein [Olpidium bornovanus]
MRGAEGDIAAKVKKYEEFLNTRLKVDLKETLDARDKVFDATSDMKLADKIRLIKQHNLKEMKTMVDVGSNFYVQAKIPDTRYIYVDVGYGFHVQLTLDEALAFIEKKEKHLEKRAEKFTKEAAKIRAHIGVVLEALAEIMKLHSDGRNFRNGDVWVTAAS